MLTVALDATPLLGQRTGIGVAVAGYLRHLACRQELAVVGYGLTARGGPALASQVPQGVRAAARPLPAGALLRLWRLLEWPPAEWWTGSVDVVHGTNFVVPPARRAGRVVSVWDMTAVRFPQLCTATSLRYPALVARAVARGAWVHTGAEHVKDEVVEHFGVDPVMVRVVAPPVELPSADSAQRPSPGEGPPYILGLGRVEPRKDFRSLVRAFGLVAERQREVELRIAGPPGWDEEALRGEIAASPHRDRIRRVGWVADVAAEVRGASVFAFPSVYEGFGFPPLEAMAAGVPVVATSAGALPEVLGDAAEMVPPGDVAALAAALERALVDEALRSSLVDAGRRRVRRFSGAAAADGLVALYRDVAAGG